MIKTLIFDASFEGFLTAIYDSFYLRTMNVEIHSVITHCSNFLNMEVLVETDEIKAQKVYRSIETKLNKDILRQVYYLYLYDTNASFTLAFKYLKLAFKYGSSISLAKNNDIIILVDKYCRRVTLEAHRFTGFVRFKEVSPMVFYSKITPDYNILPLLINHFANRFSDQNFIIHDHTRELAIFYNKEESIIAPLSQEKGDELSNSSINEDYEELWKSFYKSTTIKERLNPRQQRGYMPKRYWVNLNELS
ncbi:TIGR03915 family putative DNA repair protein [Clostridium cadaveris]|uniref:TIGR03915 family putative DNA repair protein n=1 Tax=Clostridium cadaveris TaxID=1529 RepID=UPI0031D2FF63